MDTKPQKRLEDGKSIENQAKREKEEARKWSGTKPDRGADQNRVKPSD